MPGGSRRTEPAAPAQGGTLDKQQAFRKTARLSVQEHRTFRLLRSGSAESPWTQYALILLQNALTLIIVDTVESPDNGGMNEYFTPRAVKPKRGTSGVLTGLMLCILFGGLLGTAIWVGQDALRRPVSTDPFVESPPAEAGTNDRLQLAADVTTVENR